MTHSRLVASCAHGLALAALTLLLPGRALAGDAFYDLTLDLKISDDARFFLNLTNQHFLAPSQGAVTVVKRCPRPADDFPVVMLLAAASRRPADDVLAMRLRGLAWSDVLFELHVSPQVLFVGMDRDPGPPYGQAWGHWKDHKGQPKKGRFALPDAQVVELAKLQIASSYYRVSPYTIVGERRRGMSVERYTVIKGRPAGAAPARNAGAASSGVRPERGQGHAHGHGQPPKNH